jgi:ACS family glucarate transporter-like MFS transporter
MMSQISYVIIAVSLLGMALSKSSFVFLLFAIIGLFFLNPILLSSWRLSTRIGGENSSSFVGGWMNFWGNIGGILAPIVIAWLNDLYGLSRTFLISISIPVMGLACWAVMSGWEKNEK